MTSRAARNEVADRRFAAASIPAGAPPKPPTFRTDTPYLSLGILTADECVGAERMIRKLAANAGAGQEVLDDILDMLLKDYRR